MPIGLKRLFQSKKFVATIIGIIGIPLLSLLNRKLGLEMNNDEILSLIGLMAAYVVGQSLADGWTDGKTSNVAQGGLREMLPVPPQAPPPMSPVSPASPAPKP